MEIEAVSYLKFLLALLFVLGLIGGLGIIAKRVGLGNRGPIVKGKSKRLSIVETMALDPKRRVVLIQCDNSQHLLLLGSNSEQTIVSSLSDESSLEKKPGQPSFLRALEQPRKVVGRSQ